MGKINHKLIRFIWSRETFHVNELNPYHPKGKGENLLEGLRGRGLITSLGNKTYRTTIPDETVDAYLERAESERHARLVNASRKSPWRRCNLRRRNTSRAW